MLAVHRVLCGALLLLLSISSASTTSFREELRAVFEWLAVFPHAFKDDAVSPVSTASPQDAKAVVLVVEPLTCVFRPVEKGSGVLRIVSAEHGDRAAQDAKTGAIAGFVEGSFVNAAVFVFLLCMLYAGR